MRSLPVDAAMLPFVGLGPMAPRGRQYGTRRWKGHELRQLQPTQPLVTAVAWLAANGANVPPPGTPSSSLITFVAAMLNEAPSRTSQTVPIGEDWFIRILISWLIINLVLQWVAFHHLGVSKNNGIPKSSIFRGFSIINHPFWGTLIFGNTHLDYHQAT